MTFPIPELVDVLSARYTATGAIDLELTVTNYLGNPEPVTIPYTRDVTEEWLPDGRLYTLGLEIDAWFFAHPEFEIEAYVAPELTPADVPLSMRQLRLGLVRNGFPVDFVQQAISAIEDDLERAEATIWYEETSTVDWSHPMTQALMAAAAAVNPAFTLELAATMWMEAAGV